MKSYIKVVLLLFFLISEVIHTLSLLSNFYFFVPPVIIFYICFQNPLPALLTYSPPNPIIFPLFLFNHQPVTFTLNLRLSQFQMSFLQSCWVTKQTLAPWSLWSLGGANFIDRLDYAYLCPHPGKRAPETLGRVTPPVCVCFAPS